ncbi:unnamed protein product [Albugo candida]|uniref:Uncharacterized protein n=1 Tax=Albugo candida TaxID=65357 RepID=A0A024GGR9_9STRA|nr:unnamed protein product [Albugo candida]|eukprot:CCI45735.1 unnamed protein product [Albugo candida]
MTKASKNPDLILLRDTLSFHKSGIYNLAEEQDRTQLLIPTINLHVIITLAFSTAFQHNYVDSGGPRITTWEASTHANNVGIVTTHDFYILLAYIGMNAIACKAEVGAKSYRM